MNSSCTFSTQFTGCWSLETKWSNSKKPSAPTTITIHPCNSSTHCYQGFCLLQNKHGRTSLWLLFSKITKSRLDSMIHKPNSDAHTLLFWLLRHKYTQYEKLQINLQWKSKSEENACCDLNCNKLCNKTSSIKWLVVWLFGPNQSFSSTKRWPEMDSHQKL